MLKNKPGKIHINPLIIEIPEAWDYKRLLILKFDQSISLGILL